MKGAQVASWVRRRSGARLRDSRPALTLVALALLAACAAVPPDDAQQSAEPAAPLSPLKRQPGTPADAPRSLVPQARYDLAIGRTEEEADDGVPGDEQPGEVYQRGGASYYGIQFHQRRTASGERFDIRGMTAAHKTLPFNTRVCVRSLVNGKEVLVRVNDRGPFVPGRVIDLSQAAAEALEMINTGIKQVSLTLIGTEGGRCAGERVAGGEVEPPRSEPVKPVQSKPAAPSKRPVRVQRTTRPRR